jgi:hypothetical protein
MWYYEERSPTGHWHPCKSDIYPTERTAESARRKLRGITKIPSEMADLPLAALQVIAPDIGKAGVSFRVQGRVHNG